MATNQDLRAGLASHNTLFDIMFEETVNNAVPGPWGAWTEQINAQGEQTINMAWLTNTPTWRTWTGSKVYKNLRNYTLSVTYDKKEATLALKRDMVQYDRTGVLGRTLQKFVSANVTDAYDGFVATSKDSNSGAGPTGFDAVALYSASHPHAPSAGTQSNLGSGTNLSHSALLTADQTTALWVEENGRPVRASMNVMRVGPRLKQRAMELLSATRTQKIDSDGSLDTTRAASSTYQIVGGSAIPNVFEGTKTLVVDPRVTTYYWDLEDTAKAYKSMILFITRAPEAISQTEMTDEQRFNHDDFVYSVECDVGVAAGHWYGTYRGTGTA